MADAEATLEAPEDEPGAAAPEELAVREADAGAGAAEAAEAAPKAKEPRKPRKGKPKDDGGEPSTGGGPSIAAHPRAARSVARAKGWGALGGFLLGGYLSLPTHTVASAGLRAIIAGLVCWVVVWAGAVFFWRRMVVLEIKAREQELVRAVEDARAKYQAAAAAGAQGAARAQAAAQLAAEPPRSRR